jgi:hypothetical protein
MSVDRRSPLTEPGGQAGDGQQIQEPAAVLGQAPAANSGQAEPKVDAGAVAVGGEVDGPAELEPPAGGAVHQAVRRVVGDDLERRVAAAPVVDHVAGPQLLQRGIDPAQGAATAGEERLDPGGQVPAGAVLAELREPRPHPLGWVGQGEAAVHHDIGVRHEVVTGRGRGDFRGAGCDSEAEHHGPPEVSVVHFHSGRWHPPLMS